MKRRERGLSALLGKSFLLFALTLAALLVPGFQELLRLSSLDGQQWLYVAGLPLAVLALSELTKFFTRNIKN